MAKRKIFLNTGDVYERLTVLKEILNSKRCRYECKCECGTILIVDGSSLTSGNTKSCGCLTREKARNRLLKHGMSATKFYDVWVHMIQRCYNVKDKEYQNYGGRNIKVCDEWKSSYDNFHRDMFSAYANGLKIDRINNDDNYCKSNCKWSTQKEQARNTRRNVYINYYGNKWLLTDLAAFTDIPIETIRHRINLNDVEEYVSIRLKSTKARVRIAKQIKADSL